MIEPHLEPVVYYVSLGQNLQGVVLPLPLHQGHLAEGSCPEDRHFLQLLQRNLDHRRCLGKCEFKYSEAFRSLDI